MAKLVWRVKLVMELQAGETREVAVARIERDEQVPRTAGTPWMHLRTQRAPSLSNPVSQ